MMGFIHSKLRNILNPKNFEKLVFIKFNLHAFFYSPTLQDYDDSGTKGGADNESVVQIENMNWLQ